MPHSKPDTHRIVQRTCPLCEATCGLEIEVRDDRVERIHGDADDVFSAGYICPKGSTLGKLHEDPDRLREPHVKRDGVHVPVSWDEAFRMVEQGLNGVRERHGDQALAIYLGNPNVHNLAGTFYVRPLIQALKTRNRFSASTVDQMPRHVSVGLMYGTPATFAVPDLDRTDYLLMLGANPLESNGSLCTAPDFPGRLRRIRERGGRVVVVDPRLTRTAKVADEHVSVRPGSDAHLLLGIAHVIFAEGLAKLGHIEAFVQGFDEAREATVPFTPDAVASRTGVPADTIRRLAREIAGARSAAVYGRIGVHTVEFGTLASWASDLVCAITGNLDRVGGLMFPYAAHARPRREEPGRGFTTGRWQSRVRGLPEVMSEFPVSILAEEIEVAGEGQVRMLVTVAGNPVLSTPNGTRLDAAFADLEFMVSVDPYLNETTRHADVILPPPSPLERSHFDIAFLSFAVRNVSNYSPPVLPSDGPSEADILARLALVAAGQGADADPAALHAMLVRGMVERECGSADSRVAGRDVDEIIDALSGRAPVDQLLDVLIRTGPYGDGFGADPDGLSLAKLEANPHGIDHGPLEPAIPAVLETTSGCVELMPDPIAQDLARLQADLAQGGGDDRLRLIGRRTVRSNNSWMHNIDVLVRGRDRCTLQLHPDDATRLGVSKGGRVRVRSRVGSIEAPVELTDEIRPGVVSLPHGYGHDMEGTRLGVAARMPGVNTNRLTDEQAIDVLSGNSVLNGIPVTVEPLAE